MSSLASIWARPLGATARLSLASQSAQRWLRDSDAFVLAGLVLWLVLGLALAIRLTTRLGGAFTGVLTAPSDDTFQYLSWVRDAGLHGLIGDNFQLGPAHYDFLQPMFVISGLLWRAGLSLPVAYLLWAPVAIVLTWWSFRRFVRHHLAGWSAAAALVLGLSYMSPLSLWAFYRGSPSFAGMIPLGWEMTSITAIWGYLPRVIAVACVPVLLLCLETAVDSRSGLSDRRVRRSVLVAAAAAGVASWLHPWQGAIALSIIAGIAAWGGPTLRRVRVLAGPALAAALPLAYYLALGHFDTNWATADAQNVIPRFSWDAQAACFLPLVVPALLGVRRSLPMSTGRRLLLLWTAACTIGYLVTPVFSTHMLNGVTLPLGILAVQGVNSSRGQRLRSRLAPDGLRLRLLVACAAGLVASSTLPGLYLYLRFIHGSELSTSSGMTFNQQDDRALSYLDTTRVAGGVLASPYIAPSVPALTGHSVWMGHAVWTPDYDERLAVSDVLFEKSDSTALIRHIVQLTGARFILIDCTTNQHLGVTGETSPEERLVAALGSEIVRRREFGCAAVLQLAQTGADPASAGRRT